ncbi:MAG: hypothetical protein II981_05875 [Bacteroidales bacterium]|nr:hypothetical protein [Bacteroidales bacterium]
MNFANSMEAMAFDKSTWNMVEKSADGKVIYMGKPKTPDAKPDDPVWHVKRIVSIDGKDGSQVIETRFAQPAGKVKWMEKENCDYKYF